MPGSPTPLRYTEYVLELSFQYSGCGISPHLVIVQKSLMDLNPKLLETWQVWSPTYFWTFIYFSNYNISNHPSRVSSLSWRHLSPNQPYCIFAENLHDDRPPVRTKFFNRNFHTDTQHPMISRSQWQEIELDSTIETDGWIANTVALYWVCVFNPPILKGEIICCTNFALLSQRSS